MLKSFIFVLAAIFVAVSSDCLSCICDRESNGCHPIGCNQDVDGIACGYFQIHLPYYKDCGTPSKRPNESVEDAWKRCSEDYNCASTCVKNYVKRYAQDCPNKGSCEQMSRIHNGGPQGCNKPKTEPYWNGIKACCGCT
uniref:lysozyme n=1 Tax=Panagrolaimus superbus TaxID=310955 RepID=A0A914YLV3_9BILA